MNPMDDLIEQLAQQNQPLALAPPPWRISLEWVAAATLYLLIALLVSGVRADLASQLEQFFFVAEIALLFAIFLSTAFSSALLSFPDLHQKRLWAWLPAVFFGLFALLLLAAQQHDIPPAPQPLHSWQCCASILLMGLLPAAATLFALRRFAPIYRRAAGSTALLFAFSVGATWLRLHEANDSIAHLIEWHYLPMLGVGILGLALGKRVLKW
jgi:hypothetical protein